MVCDLVFWGLLRCVWVFIVVVGVDLVCLLLVQGLLVFVFCLWFGVGGLCVCLRVRLRVICVFALFLVVLCSRVLQGGYFGFWSVFSGLLWFVFAVFVLPLSLGGFVFCISVFICWV